MTVIAYGADQVRHLERALFGEAPQAGVEASRVDLSRHFLRRAEERRAAREEAARFTERAREKMLMRMFEDDPDIKQDLEQHKAVFVSQRLHRVAPPVAKPFITSVPRVIAGSFEWYKNAPYDVAWTATSNASSTSTEADHVGGTYSVIAQSLEKGSISAAAGVGVYFGAPAEDTMQSFAAIINYTDFLSDSAFPGYSASAGFQTYLWVWGFTENAWVGQASITPSWNSTVTGFDGDTRKDSGFTGQYVTFSAAANQQYLAWAWSEGYVAASGGFFGGSLSTVQLNANVQYVSFSTP